MAAAADVERGAEAVFILSHVHCTAGDAPRFLTAARWILPRCRLREICNGQCFEHLHARLPSGTSTSTTISEGRYEYHEAECGFEPRNMGRGASAAWAESSGADADSGHEGFVWFEEWRDWSGVELHCVSSHGKQTHAAIDHFIEEECTFYTAVSAAVDGSGPPLPLLLPPTSYFNDTTVRGELQVVHLKLEPGADRAAVLAHVGVDPVGGNGRMREALTPAGGGTPPAYAMLLQNRNRPNELALVLELATPESMHHTADAMAAHVGTLLEAAACTHSVVLRFSPPLWPEDMAVTADQVPLEDDATTFPAL
jgi:hypothetical protein